MNGKGRGPMKGYNYQAYADNYDQIFRKPTKPKRLKTMKTNQDGKQPAPVLAWHRELAEDVRNYFQKTMLFCDIPDPLLAIIANRDPHATTVRLLEAVLKLTREIGNDFNRHGESMANYSDGEYTQDYTTRSERLAKVDCEIRAHLAALQQEGAAK